MLEAQKAQRAHRVTGVNRTSDAVRAPERGTSVAEFVAILDIVVDERVVVKDLDGDGRIERTLDRRSFAHRNAHHHLRTQPFAAPRRSVRSVTEMSQKTIGDL